MSQGAEAPVLIMPRASILELAVIDYKLLNCVFIRHSQTFLIDNIAKAFDVLLIPSGSPFPRFFVPRESFLLFVQELWKRRHWKCSVLRIRSGIQASRRK